MALVLIAGVARGGVIGRDNRLLWSLPEDMKHFRAATMGCPVIMGRRTWESLPERFRPLPGRRNLVLSRQAGFAAPGAEVVPTLADALQAVQGAPRAFVIGGEQIYRQALPHADELLLTEIDLEVEGDAHFPEVDPAQFEEVARHTRRAAPPNAMDIAFVTYHRRR